jgi:hypothetical protein
MKVINPGKIMQPQFFDIIYSASATAKEILNNRLPRHLIFGVKFYFITSISSSEVQ